MSEGGLTVRFVTEHTQGEGFLLRSHGQEPSRLIPDEAIASWNGFKERVTNLPPYRYAFRGQSCLNRLRTSFHRTSRKDLTRYIMQDVPILHQQLSPITKHLFDLDRAAQMGAFYNLIQHHGYPTPLLDWTYSPYVAAFFAFRARPSPDATHVRIFVFDKDSWASDQPNTNPNRFLTYVLPHVTILEPLGIENARMVPQQALTMVTNVDDIEGFIAARESDGRKYLAAIDLPVSERVKALTVLSMMGITAGALFPGLDGTCEALAGRNFGYEWR